MSGSAKKRRQEHRTTFGDIAFRGHVHPTINGVECRVEMWPDRARRLERELAELRTERGRP